MGRWGLTLSQGWATTIRFSTKQKTKTKNSANQHKTAREHPSERLGLGCCWWKSEACTHFAQEKKVDANRSRHREGREGEASEEKPMQAIDLREGDRVNVAATQKHKKIRGGALPTNAQAPGQPFLL
mmetsp:Transcript_40034/g.85762  ORF Transcript_40034/g.85762 Transcript_40034/m.85762 type:complete len:127 (+) Transcript_40034:152-532(+)